MKNNPFFSLIIPTYNRADFIGITLASVLKQDFENFEVWIIDDGSTDSTAEMIRHFTDSRIHYKKIINSERGVARNEGIKNATGKYVTFLDSDDVLYPMHFSYVRNQLEKYSYPEVYHQGYDISDTAGNKKQWKVPVIKDMGYTLLTKGNVMSCMGIFVKREVMIQYRFNEDRALAGMEDWECWIRLASRYEIVHDDHPTSALIQHESRSVLNASREKLQAKVTLFLDYTFADAAVWQKFGDLKNKLRSNAFTYVSLHLSTHRKEHVWAWHYLIEGIKGDINQMFTRRFIAILRNLLVHRFRE